MQIRGLSNNTLFVNNPKGKKSESVQQQDPKDKIEISSEARDLAKTDMSQQRLEEIKQRIDSKFYDSDIVLNKVADKLISELTGK
jgi:anti-sigma28 factor (negative regulator of flagellin synthesis)